MTDHQRRFLGFKRQQCPEALALEEAADRRRTGRLEDVPPPLIPLLRFKPSPEQVEAEQGHLAPSEDAEDDDSLRLMRGIAFGLAISAFFWIAVGVFLIWGW